MYIAIDLKSFYASAECVARGLDPLSTNLVVADLSRTEKTICLAVSPSLKSFGIPGRARLFEVVSKVKEINRERLYHAKGKFSGSSTDINRLKNDKTLSLDYIVAKPRMGLYMQISTEVVKTYYRFVSPEDVHVYSVDEVFVDVSKYEKVYDCSASELAMKMIKAVLKNTGITATAGVGTNLYLAKIAMDIVAKHMEADENGVRIAQLDEQSFRKLLWNHRPLTDFWRIGNGIAKSFARLGAYTMGDIARLSLEKEDLLYKTFGVNAEIIIDHAWGVETCSMKDIKSYIPKEKSLSSGQVLKCPYNFSDARVIAREMSEGLSLDLFQKNLQTDRIVLVVCYDKESMADYDGEIMIDHYGKIVPAAASGTTNLIYTSSTEALTKATVKLFDKIVDPLLLVRRINICFNHIKTGEYRRFNLFLDYEKLKKERSVRLALINIKMAYGKNAIVKGTDLLENATAMERNARVGGHSA